MSIYDTERMENHERKQDSVNEKGIDLKEGLKDYAIDSCRVRPLGKGRRKGRKTRKSRNEEKVVGFSSAFLFPTRKWDRVNQGGTSGIDHTTRRKTQGTDIVKGWKDKRHHGCIPNAFR